MADKNIPRSADKLVALIKSSPKFSRLSEEQKKTMDDFATQVTQELPPPAFVQDVWIYRLVVSSLGLVAVAAIFGAIYLTVFLAEAEATVQIPDILTALGAAAIGALAGLLAPSPKQS